MAKGSDQKVVQELSKLLANSYTLYVKTQNYHWNVTGPMFTTLHTLFETQYVELAAALDEIAERIRALDAPAPASLAAFSKLAVVREETGSPKAKRMIENLLADQGAVSRSAQAVIQAAEKSEDQASIDLATRRQEAHQKNAWMLRSHLE